MSKTRRGKTEEIKLSDLIVDRPPTGVGLSPGAAVDELHFIAVEFGEVGTLAARFLEAVARDHRVPVEQRIMAECWKMLLEGNAEQILDSAVNVRGWFAPAIQFQKNREPDAEELWADLIVAQAKGHMRAAERLSEEGGRHA